MLGLDDCREDLLVGRISDDTVHCQAVLVNTGKLYREGELLEVALCATEVSWFMTAKNTDTEYLIAVTIYVHI